MDSAGRRPGAVAQVPRLLGGLCGDGNRCRDVAVNGNAPTGAIGDLVHSVAVIPRSTTHASVHRVESDDERNRPS